jgi:two-component system, sensor histidine kinase PdtaS
MAPRQTSPQDIELNLALAVVASSAAPVVLLDGDLKIVAASKSFCSAFQIDPDTLQGRPFRDLGSGEWTIPQLDAMLKATVSGFARFEGYEIDLRRHGHEDRRLVLTAQKLDYGNEGVARLLLSIADVTEVRIAEKLKEEMSRENGLLLRELQHRVANSLQIVASVLLQSARKVQSEETKIHLVDAHQRVISVALLQKQLAISKAGEVPLRSYFTTLCSSIGASMIHDHNQLSLDVAVDESVTSADVSVSLGLIVTELVINALKHAFPKDRGGRISVGYHSRGADWTLSVVDNGIGMPVGGPPPKPGLGTSIVHALGMQLQASIEVSDAKPGTAVSIVHTGALAEKIASVVPARAAV